MKTALSLALLLVFAAPAPPEDAARQALFKALDRFYTWGDLVERFACRVHGRWLEYGTGGPSLGRFWGDLDYRNGAFRFTLGRTLGPRPDPAGITEAIRALVEQAGLLPGGFPVPPGRVVQRPGGAGAAMFDVGSDGPGRTGRVTYRVKHGRVTAVSMPDGPGRTRLAFRIASRPIPGGRYLITRLTGHPERQHKVPRIAYTYHLLAGNYFPSAIVEDREGSSLTLMFYWYEIDLNG